MPTFHVIDMTCGGCANAITEAIRQLDATAAVTADPATKKVNVESALPAARIADAIAAAGYRIADRDSSTEQESAHARQHTTTGEQRRPHTACASLERAVR